MILLLGLGNKLFINELDFSGFTQIRSSIASLRKYLKGGEATAVNGKKKKARIPEKVDKVIIRNAYHHFEFKKEMMESIHKSLNLNGIVFINEIPRELSISYRPRGCELRMPFEKITESFDKKLFELIEVKEIGDDRIFKLRKI